MEIPMCQVRSMAWAMHAFGEQDCRNGAERATRMIEEALEMVQAVGLTREKCIELVNYVYNRPVGELDQELGGLLLTTFVLAQSLGLSANEAFLTELHRVNDPDVLAKIKIRHGTKPKGGDY